jgi:uncharacterized membrane-anchored protein
VAVGRQRKPFDDTILRDRIPSVAYHLQREEHEEKNVINAKDALDQARGETHDLLKKIEASTAKNYAALRSELVHQ